MKRSPTCFIANAATGFKCVEKGMSREGVVHTAAVSTVIPVRGCYFRNAVANLGGGCGQSVLAREAGLNYTWDEGKKE